MRTLKISLLVFILSISVSAQDFDVLKDYLPNQSIIYTFFRDAYPSSFLYDTTSTIEIFNGTYRAYIDSIVYNSVDSVKSYHLTIHKVGSLIIKNRIRVLSSRNIDSLYKSIIKEYTNINFHCGQHKIKGWLFPDTVYQSLRCPGDTTIFYPYDNYYKSYYIPCVDTLDVRGDSLILTNISTDCLDIAFQSTFVITYNEGLLKRIFGVYNYFDWSFNDVFIKDEVSNIIEKNNPPYSFFLHQNYPNPFNPVTKIKYSIPQNVSRETGNVSLKIYDVLGREIATLVNEEKPAGEYEVEFNGSTLPSGIYFYQLNAGEFTQTRKMVLLK